ncbi:hypothetical protein [Nostoc sp. MG11]|uniref:hypothetical protein n=1 Tax=Nostoc sp. MG11 TaxID=2721166 RepID=UPI001D03165E|nr:hypothetical protein [Nostoc sp. MG11]
MRKSIRFLVLTVSIFTLIALNSHWGAAVMALPPPEDTPEEILRTQIITEARSPIDGKSLTAAEYAELQAQLQKAPPPKLTSNLRQTLFLLRLRKALRQVFPFFNF